MNNFFFFYNVDMESARTMRMMEKKLIYKYTNDGIKIFIVYAE